MSDLILSAAEMKAIKSRGMSYEKILEQIETFKKGLPFLNLDRPCGIGDGITRLEDETLESLEQTYIQACLSGRTMKFVPASGAASRMFKALLSVYGELEKGEMYVKNIKREDSDYKQFLRFIQEMKKFAFYDELRSKLSAFGIDTEKMILNKDYKTILDCVLNPAGMNLAHIPKGLIPFHRYPDYVRTPLEEHMVEAGAYTKSSNGNIKIHFTISTEHESAIINHIALVRGRYEKNGIKYNIDFSCQKPSTDTIAVDKDNHPFRNENGDILFRPGGHGALLENLNGLGGDIVFIKNIDNVVPDRLKGVTIKYKKVLGGYLLYLQDRIFKYLSMLSNQETNDIMFKEIFEFIKKELSIGTPDNLSILKPHEIRAYLITRLNRPIRVCGMVRNVSEPGGGPFWVKGQDGSLSIQIVETSQIDMNNREQTRIFNSSTHFNPVDLVCGLRDFSGRPFDLSNYVDKETGLITVKSMEGRELKALELPGLWNGSMAFWNTVFVEVPLITFNPVKTVIDLLRPEHQPA